MKKLLSFTLKRYLYIPSAMKKQSSNGIVIVVKFHTNDPKLVSDQGCLPKCVQYFCFLVLPIADKQLYLQHQQRPSILISLYQLDHQHILIILLKYEFLDYQLYPNNELKQFYMCKDMGMDAFQWIPLKLQIYKINMKFYIISIRYNYFLYKTYHLYQ